METKQLRKPPNVMPTEPAELLAFISWHDYYEGETEEEFIARRKLCEKLAKEYAEYCLMIRILDEDINKPKIWLPSKKGVRK